MKMEKTMLSWFDAAAPTNEIWRFVDPSANMLEIGTRQYSAGQSISGVCDPRHPVREISIVLEGEVETRSGTRIERLRAGDILTIPPHQSQASLFLADTKLVYLVFGHLLCVEDADS